MNDQLSLSAVAGVLLNAPDAEHFFLADETWSHFRLAATLSF